MHLLSSPITVKVLRLAQQIRVCLFLYHIMNSKSIFHIMAVHTIQIIICTNMSFKYTIAAYLKCSKFASDFSLHLVTLVRFRSALWSTYRSCIFMYTVHPPYYFCWSELSLQCGFVSKSSKWHEEQAAVTVWMLDAWQIWMHPNTNTLIERLLIHTSI